MKKILLVCTILLMITSLVFAVEKKVVAPPAPVGTVSNQLSAPATRAEADLVAAKTAYERWIQTGTATTAEKALMSQYIFNTDRNNNSLDAQSSAPDGYGYQWVDNQSPDTVIFGWIELNPTGTQVTALTSGTTDDGYYTIANIGFSFPFYGTSTATAYMGTNGMFNFGGGSTAYSNSCLPTTTFGSTEKSIMPYWDDQVITLSGSGGMWYQNFGTYFVAEWDNVASYSGVGNASYEVILWPNGKIKCQYNYFGGSHNSSTEGIQTTSPAGTNYLQYACNDVTNLVAGRAVVYYPPTIAPSGQCCYGTACRPLCVVDHADECATLGGTWTSGGTCGTACPANTMPGDVCCNAIPIASFPYTITGQTTNGYSNDYAPSCMGSYGTGVDVVYTFTLSAATQVHIDLTNTGSYSYPGVGLFAGCPNTGTCVAYAEASTGDLHIPCTLLQPGTYFIMVDNWPSPYFTPYDLHVDACNPCIIACDPSDIVEVTENPADPNFATNDPDGGCNSVPNMFGQIACGQTVCGVGFTYVTSSGGQGRDTDWYLFTTAQDETLSVSATSEFPFLLGIANVVGCPGTFVASTTQSLLCTPTTLTVNCLPAGTYALFMAPNAFTGVPVPMHYRAWMTCGGICPPCPFPNLDNEQVNNTCGPDAPLISCNASYCGYRGAGSDFDYYKIVLTERDSVKINVFANASVGHWPYGKGLDSYVSLLDANCTILASDDDFNGTPPDPQGFDSGLRFPMGTGYYGLPNCLDAGTYYIAVSGYSTSVGPYELNVQCAPCYSGCVPDQIVTLQPDPQSWDPTTQNVHACAHLVAGTVTQIVVPVLFAGNVPGIHVTSGCVDCGDPNCWPLSAWNLGAFVYEPATSAYVATITAAAGATGCCVCIHLDYVLPVELRAFEGLAGDNSVSLTWSTASETHTGHFVIERDGLPVANVPAVNSAIGSTYKWTDASAMNGTTYHYTLAAVSLTGDRSVLGNVSVTPSFDAATVTEYALHQNFPNPFNPTTSIAVDLVDNGTVSLKVYNLMGQEVASLMNGNMAKGRHIVNFDARNLSSGLYLYRLNVNGFVAEKKMLLMK